MIRYNPLLIDHCQIAMSITSMIAENMITVSNHFSNVSWLLVTIYQKEMFDYDPMIAVLASPKFSSQILVAI